MNKSEHKERNVGTASGVATVFVVDDDQQVRTSIEQLTNSVGLSARSFSSAEQFLMECDASASGCLVTDVRMPGMSGLDLQQALLGKNITLPVIILTGYAEVQMTVQAFKEGAFDFVQKPLHPQLLLETIQRAIEKDAAQRVRRERVDGIGSRLASLSPRETQVMRLLVTGKTTKEISAALNISLTTVDFHRNNVLRKMDVENIVELTRAADFYELSASGERASVNEKQLP